MSTHAMQPQRNFPSCDIVNSFGNSDGKTGLDDLGVIEVVGTGGHHLVAAACEARDDLVHNNSARVERNSVPRFLRYVAETGANGMPF